MKKTYIPYYIISFLMIINCIFLLKSNKYEQKEDFTSHLFDNYIKLNLDIYENQKIHLMFESYEWGDLVWEEFLGEYEVFERNMDLIFTSDLADDEIIYKSLIIEGGATYLKKFSLNTHGYPNHLLSYHKNPLNSAVNCILLYEIYTQKYTILENIENIDFTDYEIVNIVRLSIADDDSTY